MNPPELNILLIGPPIVTLNGKPVKISRRQHRALLYYLASTQKPVTRAQVCDMFWPREPEEDARKNLREALSRLRNHLRIRDVILSTNDLLHIDFDKCYVDVQDYFKTVYPLLASAEMNSTGSLSSWGLTQARQALALCHANDFLQGVRLPDSPGFENWLELSNQNFTFSRVKLLERLIDHYISTGGLDEAIILLDKALSVDRLDEEKNYLLLTIFRDKGMTRQLVDYVSLLESLYREREEPIPDKFIDLKKKAEEGTKTPDLITLKTWPLEEKGEASFVGREKEIEQLTRTMRQKGVVVITGEAGSGKTRLLKEFFNRQAYIPRLLYCKADPLATNVPFQAVIDGLTREIKDEEWARLSERDQQILDKFMHELLQGFAAKTLPATESKWLPMLQDVFYAFLALMENTALHRPVLFILDDAQWIDQASLSVIYFLYDHGFFSRNGILVIAKRIEEKNEKLEKTILRIRRKKDLETISLNPFDEAETAQFVQNVTARNPDQEFVKKINFSTGGNPFFLIECLRSIKPGLLDLKNFSEKESCQIPDSIKALVQEKVNSLPEKGKEILQAAASIGTWFTPDVLDHLVDVDKKTFVEMLEAFTAAGILKVDPKILPAGGYVFVHNIERVFIADGLEPARKREYHRSAAKAILERRGAAPELSAVIARHFEDAGEVAEAAHFWLAAGKYARSCYLRDETHNAYGRALEMISHKPFQFDPLFIHEVIVEWANYAYDLNDSNTCDTVYKTSIELGEKLQSALLIGTGLSGLGRVALMLFQRDKEVELLERARYHLEHAHHPGEEIEVCTRLGIHYFRIDEYERARDIFEDGLEIQGDFSNQRFLDSRTNVSIELSTLYCLLGYPVKAYNLAVQTINDSQLVQRRSAKIRAQITLAVALYYNGRYADVIKTAEAAYSLAEQLKLRWWQSLLDIVAAGSHLMMGNLDQAWRHSNQAVERELSFRDWKIFEQALEIQGNLFFALKEFSKAEAVYKEGYSGWISSVPNIACQFKSGVIAYQTGRVQEGIRLTEDALLVAKKRSVASIELPLGIEQVLLTSSDKSPEAIERESQKNLKEMEKRGMFHARNYSLQIQAKTAELRADYAQAVKYYVDIAEQCAAIPDVWNELEALKKVIQLSRTPGFEVTNARTRIQEILNGMAVNALTVPVKGMFLKFRRKWDRL